MNSNITVPPGHQFVQTGDGTFTFFSEAFQEACHSTTGAKAETLLHYFEGCQILEKARQFSPVIILEVGFGLGMGFLATLEALPEDGGIL